MRIACRKCDKLVDEIRVEDDMATHSIKITAVCHGETDTMEMSMEWMKSDPEFVFLIEHGIVLGWAFDGDREH